MGRQTQSDFGRHAQIATGFFRGNQDDAVTVEHRKLGGFTDRVAQPDEFILGSKAQIEVAPDLMGQFKQANAQLVGL